MKFNVFLIDSHSFVCSFNCVYKRGKCRLDSFHHRRPLVLQVPIVFPLHVLVGQLSPPPSTGSTGPYCFSAACIGWTAFTTAVHWFYRSLLFFRCMYWLDSFHHRRPLVLQVNIVFPLRVLVGQFSPPPSTDSTGQYCFFRYVYWLDSFHHRRPLVL